jgi:hypothetical protein
MERKARNVGFHKLYSLKLTIAVKTKQDKKGQDMKETQMRTKV